MADDKDIKMKRIAGVGETRFLGSDVFESSRHTLPPSRRGGTIREEAREIDVYHTTDVCVVGVSPSISPKFPVVSVPYGSLVPRALDGLLAAGRHMSCDANSHGFMREIPQCWLTGHAAGVGAAIAANRGIQPREVDVDEVRKVLREQGAHLHDDAAVKASRRDATIPAG